MIVFGGLRLGDLWEFDFARNKWTLLMAAPSTDSLQHPGARHGCGHAVDVESQVLYIFGGYNFEGDVRVVDAKFGPLEDLWAYWRVANDWQRLVPSHPKGGRTYTSLVLLPVEKSLVLFAGAHCHGRCKCFGDSWTFDLAAGSDWEHLQTGEEPVSRYKQSMVVSDGVLYTFGGESYEPYMYHNSILALGLTTTVALAPTEMLWSSSFLLGATALFGVAGMIVLGLFYVLRGRRQVRAKWT